VFSCTRFYDRKTGRKHVDSFEKISIKELINVIDFSIRADDT